MRDSMVFYRSFFNAIKSIQQEEQLKVYTAIMEYALNGTEIELSDVPLALFTVMKPQIDANNDRYINGRKGGRPKTVKPEDSNGCNNKKPMVSVNAENKKPNDNVNENDNVNDNVNVDENDKKENLKRKIFKPPTPNEVREYCEDKGYSVDADRFVDFYACKGWMVGKTKMKDWKAAARNWARSNPQRQELTAEPKSVFDEWRDA